jgi:murein DD-endopeptidase MepM/ murein hydrolase activator NlpD
MGTRISRRRLAVVATAVLAALLPTASAMGMGLGVSRAAQPGDCTPAGGRAAKPSYGWPVKPFHRQHPVRGYFGDPRIGGHGGTSFHFGVDVSAPDGTAVYATESGRVVLDSHHRRSVVIVGDDGTIFSYWHVQPSVRGRQRVVAYETVIGRIREGWGHVHFAERRGGLWLNPLRPGAMGPYQDATCPAISSIGFEYQGRQLQPSDVEGSVDIVATASDDPAVSAPAPWEQMPVTPALVRFRIVNDAGRAVVGWRTAFDVRSTFPRAEYGDVYAPGTTQNHPYRPGTYHFYLARAWDSSRLGAGTYELQVVATDTGGNRTRAAQPFVVS